MSPRSPLAPRAAPLLLALLAGCSGETLIPVDTDAGPRPDAQVLDAGVTPHDGGAAADAAPDAGAEDAGFVDAGAEDAGPVDAGPIDVPCGFDQLGPADGPRVVLTSHPFTDDPQVPGTVIRSLSLAADGALTDVGTRLEVGTRVARIAFVPRGDLALVLGEDGTLVSVRVNGPQDLLRVDSVTLPSAGYGDLKVLADGQTVIVAGTNSTPGGGLSTVRLGCDGRLTVDTGLFFPLRLVSGFAFTSDEQTVWVAGGQALFDPGRDERDVRVLARRPDGTFVEKGAFDVFTDYLAAENVALSPDGSTFFVPNGLDFSSEADQLAVISVSGENLVSATRLTGITNLTQLLFAPDGATLLATRAESNRVAVLTQGALGWAVVDTIAGIGLGTQLAMVSRGSLTGLTLIPSVDTNGMSNVARLAVDAPGTVRDLGQLDLGMGFEQIPEAIAITP
jgi:hypothetical protein